MKLTKQGESYMKKILLLFLMGVVLFTGCKKDSEEVKSLVVAQNADAKSLDPHATNDSPSSRVMVQVYNTLVERDNDLNLIPGLAESWEEVSPTEYIFNLRKGVKFHNGNELKSSDVVFTLKRMLDSPRVHHIVGPIKDISSMEDYKVKVSLSKPFAPLLFHLAHPASSILNEEAVKNSGEDYGQQPVGTGPFKFEEWLSGDRIVLSKFDDYFRGASQIDEVVFRNIVEGTNRVIGLETEEIHISYDISPIDLDQIKNNNSLKLMESSGLSMNYLGFNTIKSPFKDPKVRNAVAHAVNVDDILEAVLMNSGVKANSSVPKGVFGYADSIEPIKFDPEFSKQLLKESGIEGFNTKIWTNDDPTRRQIAEVVQAQLKEIGITAEIESLEWGAFLEGTAREEHEIIILGWGNVTGDADYSTYAVFHSSTPPAAGRRTIYSNSEVDRLLDIARETTDADERMAAYYEAQMIIKDEAPLVPLYYPKYNAGLTKDVSGFSLNPMGHHSLYGVSLQ